MVMSSHHRAFRPNVQCGRPHYLLKLALLRDTLDMIDKTNEPGILISLDQERAFDRVDHEVMMRVLRKFGFGPSFCGWVELFYSKASSKIIVIGSLFTYGEG